MIIKYFKLFETRSTDLSKDEFFDIMFGNCKTYLNDPFPITRSKKEKGSEYSFIDPTKHERQPLKFSQASTGYYTEGVHTNHIQIIIDELPTWNKFPKRKNSIIASSGIDHRTLFGNEKFFIIPFDGAKFGVSPSADIWIPDMIGQYGRISLNDKLTYFLKKYEISDKDINSMLNDIENLYQDFIKNKLSDTFASTYNPIGQLFYYAKNEKITKKEFKQFFIEKFAPENFQHKGETFKLMDIDGIREISQIESKNREIWTDSPCLIISVDTGGLIPTNQTLTREFLKLKKFINDRKIQ